MLCFCFLSLFFYLSLFFLRLFVLLTVSLKRTQTTSHTLDNGSVSLMSYPSVMQKLSAVTSSALRKHGLRAQHIRLPSSVAITHRTLTSTPHYTPQCTPDQPRHSSSATENLSPPASKAQFSASKAQGLNGLDGNSQKEDHKPPNDRIVKLGKSTVII